jgi:probable HAF family extracellular repeat protein
MKSRSLLFLLALAACEPATEPSVPGLRPERAASTTAGYALTRLGFFGEASAINDLAVVVGFDFHNAYWYRSGVLGTLASVPGAATTYAKDINNAGQVVGYVETDQAHAVMWSSTSGPATLIATNLAYSQAHAINDAGVVVGVGTVSLGANTHAFRWSASTGTVDLNPAWASASEAFDIDNTGVVTGRAMVTATGQWVAMRWNPQGLPSNLGTLPGGDFASGRTIGGGGTIGGFSNTSPGTTGAGFLWTASTGMKAISGFSAILGASSHGRIVGTQTQATGLSRLAATRLLSDLTKGAILLPGLGGLNSDAYGVNTCGTVVGDAQQPDGQYQAVLWRQKACDP